MSCQVTHNMMQTFSQAWGNYKSITSTHTFSLENLESNGPSQKQTSIKLNLKQLKYALV